MSTLSKMLVPVKHENNKDNYIRISISFNRETYHWATGNEKKKGYQVTVTPIQKSGLGSSFGAFNGFFEIILPCERQSKKRLLQAELLVQQKMDKYKAFFEAKGYIFE